MLISDDTFALAKIQPPRPRADHVVRTALEGAVAAALAQRRVAALIAPAGFGKSVALAGALARLPAETACAWLSLDEDDDAARLFGCLVAALEPFDLPWRIAPEALPALSHGGPKGLAAALSVLANTLTSADVARGVIALDDVHRLRDPSALSAIESLVQWLPANWSLGVASRGDAGLPLARWRARGELASFGVAELRFAAPDIAALIGTTVDDPRTLELFDRTQGWAAGLRLLQGAPGDAGAIQSARRYVAAYFGAEVFDALEPDLRNFLLRTSVLPELTAARCAAVTGDAGAAAWLDEVERRGLFTTALDLDEPALRLHDLFRDFLQQRLQRDLPGELPSLLVRAAATEPDPVRRVGWLLRAQAVDDAERALLQSVPRLISAGADGVLLRLIGQFPSKSRRQSPLLAFARGLVALPRYEWVTMQQSMRRAAEGFARSGMDTLARRAAALEVVSLVTCGRLDEAVQRLDSLRGAGLERDTEALAELMAYWTHGALGPCQAPAPHLQHMTDLLGAGSPPPVWVGCTPHFMFLGRPGVHAALERWSGEALAVAGDAHPMLRAGAHLVAAWVALWRGSLDRAEQRIALADADLRWLGEPRGLQLMSIACHGALHALRGRREPLARAFGHLLDDVERDPERRATWRGVYLLLAAHCAAAASDWPRVRDLAAQLERTAPDREWPYARVCRRALAGRVALHDGQAATAVAALGPAIEALVDVDMLGTGTTYRVVLAQALLRGHRAGDAWQALLPALSAAAADGHLAPLLLAGADALDEVACGRFDALADPAALTLLRRCAQLARALHDGLPGVCGRPGETAITTSVAGPTGLSPREADVLARIAEGHSNKQIARGLGLSPHTVKRHVANILDKLALASRGQAGAWYRDQRRH